MGPHKTTNILGQGYAKLFRVFRLDFAFVYLRNERFGYAGARSERHLLS